MQQIFHGWPTPIAIRLRFIAELTTLLLICAIMRQSEGEATFKAAKDNRCLGTYMSLEVRTNVGNARKCAMICSSVRFCQSFSYYFDINTCIMHAPVTSENYAIFGYVDQEKLSCQFYFTVCPTGTDWVWFAMQDYASKYYYINGTVTQSYDKSDEFCKESRYHSVKFETSQEMSLALVKTKQMMERFHDSRAYIGAQSINADDSNLDTSTASTVHVVWSADGTTSNFPITVRSTSGSCLSVIANTGNVASTACVGSTTGFLCECEDLDQPVINRKRKLVTR